MKEFILSKKAKIGPCMDVRSYCGRIYAIQRQGTGRLCVLSQNLEILCFYDGIGNARQIEIKDGIAYVTAREDGLWIFDVRKDKPMLLSHYVTVEFATGITLYRNFVLVSCRQYGVEIIDVKNLQKPKYVGVVRIGETQSACVYNDVLYGGVWGKMKVVAVDISDITAPQKIAEYPLSGRGDGVVAKDGFLYASTGQHLRGIKNAEDKNDPCFGGGYGVECFDISDPKSAKQIKRVQFDKSFSLHFDMWKPMLCGDTLVCSSSVLGVYGIDKNTFEKKFRILSGNEAVTGVCELCGKLYVTTGDGDIYVVSELELDKAYRHDISGSIAYNPTDTVYSVLGNAELKTVFWGECPVLGVSEVCGCLALACGERGVVITDKDGRYITEESVGGFCYDVKAGGNYLCTACGEKGIKIFSFEREKLAVVSSFCDEAPIQQLMLSENGKYLAVTCGGNMLKMLDISNVVTPRIVYEYNSDAGLLYGENFLTHSYMEKGISLFWHRLGLLYTDPEDGDGEFHVINYPMKTGFTAFCPANGCDAVGEKILFARIGGYVLLDETHEYADCLEVYKNEHDFCGKFCVSQNLLISTERAEGIISITDISDIRKPNFIAKINTNATPSKAVVIDNRIYVPMRFGGLAELKLTDVIIS